MIEIKDDAHWHALRARNIGGSEIATLFGLSPYKTLFTLWHEKAGLAAIAPMEDNPKANWGKLLEPLIAQETGKLFSWRLEQSKHYYESESIKGAGCTLDFEILDHQWGPGICETKVVFDYADYKRDWSDDRAPPNYELQVQHQLAVTGRQWCAIAVWIAQTATLMPPLIRRPNPAVISEINGRVCAFWESIGAKEAPDPSGTEEELSIMRHLWPQREPKKVVEIADPQLTEAASLYIWSSEQIPGLEREKTARKAQLLAAAKDAELLRVPNFDIAIKQNVRGSVSLKVREADNGVVGVAPHSTLEAG